MSAAHCHYGLELPNGYLTVNMWSTETEARHAAEHLYGEPDAKMIAMHAPDCACPERNGTPA